jgi:hypothetical protein
MRHIWSLNKIHFEFKKLLRYFPATLLFDQVKINLWKACLNTLLLRTFYQITQFELSGYRSSGNLEAEFAMQEHDEPWFMSGK